MIKAWEQAESGKLLTPTVAYIMDAVKGRKVKWTGTPEGIVKTAYAVAAGSESFLISFNIILSSEPLFYCTLQELLLV